MLPALRPWETIMKFEDLCVLVIDDSSYIRDLVRQMLSGIGITCVHEAADGIEGLLYVTRKDVDVILCDLGMEPMNGMGFIESLRKLENKAINRIPVIVLTVHDEVTWVEEVAKLGIDGYLLKPISMGQLKERLEKAFAKVRAESAA